MRMGFDLDDVVFVSLPAILRDGIGLGLIPEWVTPKHVRGRVEDQWHISPEDMRKLLNVSFFEGLNPAMEIVADIRRWIDDGETVFFITSRSDSCSPGIVESTVGCVDRCGLLDGSGGVIHERSTRKWERASDLRLDSFVDDMPHVIRPMVGIIPHPYLLATEHNCDVDDLRRWKWSEIRDEIDDLRESS